MADNSLSPDEIEALLQDADNAFPSDSSPVVSGGGGGGSLSSSQQATLQEIASTIADGHASSLSVFSTKNVTIGNMSVSATAASSIKSMLSGVVVEAKVTYSGDLNGSMFIYTPEEAGIKIATFMMGQEESELTDFALQALSEAFSQMIGGGDTAVSGKYGGNFSASVPDVTKKDNTSSISASGEMAIVKAKMNVDGSLSNTDYIIAFEMSLAKGFLSLVTGGSSMGSSLMDDASIAGDLDSLVGGGDMGGVNIQGADFGQLSPAAEIDSTGNLGLLVDVTMNLTVELGRTQKTVHEILLLGEGSIIELDKLAGEPVDLLVNNKLIARGEVVVIDENFGVRVTEIVNPKDRLGKGN